MDRNEDPLYSASGRLSHAVRLGLPEEEIEQRRRELAGVRLARMIDRLLADAGPPTPDQVKVICKRLAESAA